MHYIESKMYFYQRVLSLYVYVYGILFYFVLNRQTNFNMYHVIYLKFRLSIDSENCTDQEKIQN